MMRNRKRDIGRLLDKGKSINEIAEILKIKRHAVERSMEHHKLRWKNTVNLKSKKINKKIEKELHQNIVNYLYQRTLTLAEKEGPGSKKAIEYIFYQRNNKIDKVYFQELKTIFDRYYGAICNKKILSLKELGEGTDLYPSDIRRILKKVGLYSIKMKEKRPNLETEIIECIERGYETKLGNRDIAYFLGISERTVYCHVPKENKERCKLKHGLSYKLAHQIYEARDLGFEKKEITFLLGIKNNKVDYALNCRGQIEKGIINALNIMFNID